MAGKGILKLGELSAPNGCAAIDGGEVLVMYLTWVMHIRYTYKIYNL